MSCAKPTEEAIAAAAEPVDQQEAISSASATLRNMAHRDRGEALAGLTHCGAVLQSVIFQQDAEKSATEQLVIELMSELLGLYCPAQPPADAAALLQLLNHYPTSVQGLASDRLTLSMAQAALVQMESFFNVEQYPDLAEVKIQVQREAFQQLFKFCDCTFTLLTI